ncbi:hypothetical protein LIER_17415 [Lithospermum erythrorhizon]|uniref:Uncharacterized protein n=1 Tax=Lithospermum erythrorhizon TaxID=34254 RepID=A0AAV3QCS0_LITER
MAFRLKNAGATYQRMVNKEFSTQIGRDHSLPFNKIIKKGREFEWNLECEQSFQELKAYLQSSQLLARPVAGDVLQLYLVVSESALSSILIRKEGRFKGRFIMVTFGTTTGKEFLSLRIVGPEEDKVTTLAAYTPLYRGCAAQWPTLRLLGSKKTRSWSSIQEKVLHLKGLGQEPSDLPRGFHFLGTMISSSHVQCRYGAILANAFLTEAIQRLPFVSMIVQTSS